MWGNSPKQKSFMLWLTLLVSMGKIVYTHLFFNVIDALIIILFIGKFKLQIIFMAGGKMNNSLCEICEEVAIETECSLCKRKICRSCLSEDICVICNETLCANCKNQLSDRACNICGLLVCEDCSIKINEEIICLNCDSKRRFE